MYCPKCGKPEQQVNTFCRNCGTSLPDFDKLQSKIISPKQHFNASAILNLMTAIVSAGLSITLYVMFLGKDDTPFIIYLTAGFLTAMFFWQAQAFWRTLQLKKQFPGLHKNIENQIVEETSLFESPTTNKLLNESDLSDIVPLSVVPVTTNKLSEKARHLSS